ncbi:glycoside hydrolase/deacetylase [Piromyces finnis]|uniref:Glycoside hydrolase/deacetylase n=1 Tax=Piromyces finnis TaxID=1754191 RepID=A0A1Y1VAL4_9FUNG|nr:glycoside hydrolase/deacetylase [Piromyces finnis]|eukprot:ORX51159.1 glycoside hydrolase/deacetylase [Piromyces finnis]
MKCINFTLAILTLISSKSVLADESGRCGGEFGQCPEGSCCSQWGWCGTTSAFCDAGCLPEFGICNERGDEDIDSSITTNGQCGHGHGICPEGQCCSSVGWCGMGEDYCLNGCQSEFGACGQSAIDDATVEGFSYYNTCVNDKYWAMTFDDGPYIYDDALLDLLSLYRVKATFFITGASAMGIETQKAKRIIKRMYKEGHVIASHTWSHVDLTTLSTDEVVDEMINLDSLIEEVIGKKPAFVRPPYGSGNGNVKLAKTLKNLGYSAAVTWNIDTMDWNNEGDIDYALEQFKGNVGHAALSLNHANYNGITKIKLLKLAKAEIEYMLKKGYKPVTMDKCLGLPAYQ